MKRLLTILVIPVLLGFGILVWWNDATRPPATDATPQPFVIQKGLDATKIAKTLEKEGFIRSALAFRLWVQFTNKASSIQAGDYRLSKNKTLPNLVKELTRGPIGFWVTLPEGMRREEVGQKITRDLEMNPTETAAFLSEFDRLTRNHEGYLFPDTYLFLKTASPSVIVTRLTDTFELKVDNTLVQQAQQYGLTLSELVTLASIIERETRTDEERPVVAGILLKRLEIGMPLQADATLQYAVANLKCQISNVKCNWWEPITVEDKKVNSSYNTYANRGLPPAPIANPGFSSLKAAANPEESDYLYYLHDSQGQIHYARTFEEHQENIRKYL